MCFDDFANLCGEKQILAANAFALLISRCQTAQQTLNLARFFSLVSTMLASIGACQLQEELATQNNTMDIDENAFVPPFSDFER